jgi:hypothetical protein
MEHPKRSIPLLEYAVEAAAEDNLKEQAAMALFESYLDVRDWSRAERIFPDARKRLSVPEETDWCTRIAVAAAASGERAEAMRIWLVAANANPARPLWLRQLAKHGLKDKLNAFYQNLAKQLPESNAPAKALKILEEVK